MIFIDKCMQCPLGLGRVICGATRFISLDALERWKEHGWQYLGKSREGDAIVCPNFNGPIFTEVPK